MLLDRIAAASTFSTTHAVYRHLQVKKHRMMIDNGRFRAGNTGNTFSH